jgi:hypothetical protein
VTFSQEQSGFYNKRNIEFREQPVIYTIVMNFILVCSHFVKVVKSLHTFLSNFILFYSILLRQSVKGQSVRGQSVSQGQSFSHGTVSQGQSGIQ